MNKILYVVRIRLSRKFNSWMSPLCCAKTIIFSVGFKSLSNYFGKNFKSKQDVLWIRNFEYHKICRVLCSSPWRRSSCRHTIKRDDILKDLIKREYLWWKQRWMCRKERLKELVGRFFHITSCYSSSLGRPEQIPPLTGVQWLSIPSLEGLLALLEKLLQLSTLTCMRDKCLPLPIRGPPQSLFTLLTSTCSR